MLPAAAAFAAGLIAVFGGGGSISAANNHRPGQDARLLRQIERATTAKPGTIVLQKVREFVSPRGTRGPDPLVVENVVETPVGQGPRNYRDANITAVPGRPSAQGITDGVERIYLSKTNTVYAASIWARTITKGKAPGTLIYRHPKDTLFGSSYPQTVVDENFPTEPLTLTAAQAHAVLDGAKTIGPGSQTSLGGSPASVIASVAGFPVGTPVAGLSSLLKSHDLRIVGRTTVDGRRAIELAGPRFKYNPHDVLAGGGSGVKFWVDAKTYAPIKETVDRPPVSRSSETWLKYETLPITPRSERLLSPLALHPDARIDRNYKSFVNATYRWFTLQARAVPPRAQSDHGPLRGRKTS